MSNRALTAARNIKAGGPSNKAVLNCLCDHADGADQWRMPVKQIADETELSDDTVRRCLADLVARGLITRTPTKRYGGRWHDIYTVTLPATCGDPSPHHAETLLAPCGDPPRTMQGDSPHHGGDIDSILEHQGSEREAPQASPAPSAEGSPKKQKRSKPATVGTVIADDWEPSDVDIAFAKDQGLTDLDIDRDKVKFRNYYRERRTVRKSWPKTWENWVIGTAEKFGRVPVVTAPGAPVSPRFQVFVDTPQWEAWREYWKRTRNNLSPKEDDIRDKKTGRLRRGWEFESEYPPGYQQEPAKMAA